MDSRKPADKRHADQERQPVDSNPPPIPNDRDNNLARRQHKEDSDANVGSDFDAMPDTDDGLSVVPTRRLSVPNSVFRPARILINPRCVTTYAGVSHTQLALDLFGPGGGGGDPPLPESGGEKYTLDDWEGAPESFVCQEQKYAVDIIPEIVKCAHVYLPDPLEVAAQPKPNGDWVSLFTKRLNVFHEAIPPGFTVYLPVGRIHSSFRCLLRHVDCWTFT